MGVYLETGYQIWRELILEETTRSKSCVSKSDKRIKKVDANMLIDETPQQRKSVLNDFDIALIIEKVWRI